MSIWREELVNALAAKDSLALQRVFDENPRITAHVTLREDEKAIIAEAWVNKEMETAPVVLTGKSRRLRISQLIRQLPSSLYAICRSKDPQLAQALIAYALPSQFHIVDGYGRSPLYYAATIDDHEIAYQITQMMLQRLTQAQDEELLNSLINQIDDPPDDIDPTTETRIKHPGKSLLHRVAYAGNIEIINLLLGHGVEVVADENLPTPMALLCDNPGRNKSDAQMIAGLQAFLDQGYDFAEIDEAGTSPLHIACEQYMRKQVGADVIFYLLQHTAFNVLTLADKNGLKPFDYIVKDRQEMKALLAEMKKTHPALYFEYVLTFFKLTPERCIVSDCLRDFSQDPKLFGELCLKILQCELYGIYQPAVQANLLYSLHMTGCALNILSDAVRMEIIAAYMGGHPSAFLPVAIAGNYQVAVDRKRCLEEILQQNGNFTNDQLEAKRQELLTVKTELDNLTAQSRTARYERILPLLLTLPYNAETDLSIKAVYAWLVHQQDDIPNGYNVESLLQQNPDAFCNVLFKSFEKFIRIRCMLGTVSTKTGYRSVNPDLAQQIITEIFNLKERNTFFKQFCPGLAYFFAKSYHETFIVNPQDPAEALGKYKVVFDALLEAGEFPGAKELLNGYAEKILSCPLADLSLKRDAKRAVSTAPRVVVVKESVCTSLTTAYEKATASRAVSSSVSTASSPTSLPSSSSSSSSSSLLSSLSLLGGGGTALTHTGSASSTVAAATTSTRSSAFTTESARLPVTPNSSMSK